MNRESIERELEEVTAQRDNLAKAIKPLIKMWEDMNDPEWDESGSFSGAYYAFYKGQTEYWESAISALKSVKINNS